MTSKSHIYVAEFDGVSKVGVSNSPHKRKKDLKKDTGQMVLRFFTLEVGNAIDVEARVKYLLRDIVTPFHGIATECFDCDFEYLKGLVVELTSCDKLPSLITKKMEGEPIPLPLYIGLKYNGNISAFARVQGVRQDQAARWLKRDCMVIDGKVYCVVSKKK